MKNLMAGLVALAVITSGLAAQDTFSIGNDAAEPEAVDVALKSKTMRKWNLVLPQEQWGLVGTGWDFQGTHGKRFAAKPLGTSLEVDVDGDGTMDVALEADAKRSLVTLKGERDGKIKTYAAFVQPTPQGWVYRAAHVRRGKIGDTRIQLIDQNNNGRFDEVGEDAMIVGNGRYASLLSEVVSVDGRLWSIEVATDGSKLSAKNFAGKTGRFDLATGLKTDAKLLSAIVGSTDGRYSFELAKAADGLEVPAGSYRLLTGRIGLGSQQVNLRTGHSRPFDVEEGGKTAAGWGGPVKATFQYARDDEKIELSPKRIQYYGDQGEEYHGWNPDGKSPKFTITNRMTGKEIAIAYFPGSC